MVFSPNLNLTGLSASATLPVANSPDQQFFNYAGGTSSLLKGLNELANAKKIMASLQGNKNLPQSPQDTLAQATGSGASNMLPQTPSVPNNTISNATAPLAPDQLFSGSAYGNPSQYATNTNPQPFTPVNYSPNFQAPAPISTQPGMSAAPNFQPNIQASANTGPNFNINPDFKAQAANPSVNPLQSTSLPQKPGFFNLTPQDQKTLSILAPMVLFGAGGAVGNIAKGVGGAALKGAGGLLSNPFARAAGGAAAGATLNSLFEQQGKMDEVKNTITSQMPKKQEQTPVGANNAQTQVQQPQVVQQKEVPNFVTDLDIWDQARFNSGNHFAAAEVNRKLAKQYKEAGWADVAKYFENQAKINNDVYVRLPQEQKEKQFSQAKEINDQQRLSTPRVEKPSFKEIYGVDPYSFLLDNYPDIDKLGLPVEQYATWLAAGQATPADVQGKYNQAYFRKYKHMPNERVKK